MPLTLASYNGQVPREYSLIPRPVQRVETKLRRIVTDIPAPGSIETIERLRANEPIAMQGQPPVVWHRAENFQVHDKWGNTWIDWSSGVLITNAGHGRQEIVDAIVKQAQSKLLTNYCFPSDIRAELTQKLKDLLPEPLKKIFLLTTGSETVECAIKLSRAYAKKHHGAHKNVIVSYEKAFHGRTLGSQQAGGIPALKEWIGNLDPGFVQVPFPDGFRTPDTSFDFFLECLKDQGVEPGQIAGVILETYQGGSASFAPAEYMQRMYAWTREHDILLTCDEVQAGFGRTGALWGFEHYGIVPDLTTWGKGVSSSLPLAFVAGRPDVMDIFPAGSMTSTHTGNPVCCAAAIASIDLVIQENLVQNSAEMGTLLLESLRAIQAQYPEAIACVDGKGLVAGVACVKPGTLDPDPDLAFEIVNRMMEKGVLLFSPVGFGGATIKICPPLTITREAIEESTQVLSECFAEILQPVARA
jgi:4-aminobutyrate aminotransferase-like enzyme